MIGTTGGRRRARIPFNTVNRSGERDYDPGFQRHHLLPRQLLSDRCFGAMFHGIGRNRIDFDDFRANGLLLPATDAAAVRIGLPLHRGPHHVYNQLVIERVAQIEKGWCENRAKVPDIALEHALMRLTLLQRALRRRLLDQVNRRFILNRNDPIGRAHDYRDLDAMADLLWGATGAE